MQPFPNPLREVFAGRVLKAFYVVQVVVIELLVERLKDPFHVRKIHHPAGFGFNRATDVNGNLKRVSVKAGALVAVGYVGETMRRFDSEFAEYLHRLLSPSAESAKGIRRESVADF